MSSHPLLLAFVLVVFASSNRSKAERFSNSSNSLDLASDGEYFESCSNCGPRNFKRNYRLESIKSDILRKLRMTTLPNMTGIRVPNLPHLQMIIDSVRQEMQQAGQESDNELSTTLTMFRLSRPDPPPNPDPSVVYFDLQSKEFLYPNQILSSAFCIFIRKLSNADPDWYTHIVLYAMPGRELLERKLITSAQLGQWISFNITSTVRKWILQNDSTHHGLEVLCLNNSEEPLAITQPRNDEEMNNRPYLHMDIKPATSRRRKRNVDSNSNCDESSSEQKCCRYPLEVNFEEFGWDWIIIPKTYSAYYCSGDCPVWVVSQNSHSHVAQQNEKFKGMCCAPRSTSSISMLYYDERMNIVYGRLPGMTVNNCSCI